MYYKTVDTSGYVLTSHAGGLRVSFEDRLNFVHVPKEVDLEMSENHVTMSSKSKMFLNTLNSILRSAMAGLKVPFVQKVNLSGVGYSVEWEGDRLKFKLGYSHPVYKEVSSLVNVRVDNRKSLTLSSVNKEHLGAYAKGIEMLRKPNPYTGHGVHLEGKFYLTKKVNKK